MYPSYMRNFIILLIFSVSVPCNHSESSANNNSISAIYVFGDSTVDPGNNNYIATVLQSNFLPYGMDLPGHTPTGRFSNGRLTTDFIGSYFGIKDFIPAYLNKSLGMDELMTGVSFASAGSGYDPLTAQLSNVISMQKQIEYFKEYKVRLEAVMGTDKMEKHIRRAVFFVSCGTNDFAANYFRVPIRQSQYSVAEYQNLLTRIMRDFLQRLLDLGARKIGVIGLPPIGCLPIVITEHSVNGNLQRQCIGFYSTAASQYNRMLQNELRKITNMVSYSGIRIEYLGIYEPLLDLIQSHKKYGFEEWRRGCCGSGQLETSYLCNQETPICPDPSKFIFWDSVHPTEIVYYRLFMAIRDVLDTIT